MSIEENIARLAEAQERTATALEAILAHLGSSTSLTLATGVVGADVVEVDTPDDQAIAEAKAAEEAAKKKAAEEAAKKKAVAEAKAKKEAEEKAAAAAEVDPLDDAGAVEEKAYTLDDVRKALMEYRAIEGAPAMMEVLKTHGGAESLSAVKPANYAAIMKAVNVK